MIACLDIAAMLVFAAVFIVLLLIIVFIFAAVSTIRDLDR